MLRLEKVNTGVDIGVFHVVNPQPFHSWNTALSRQKLSVNCDNGQSWDEGASMQNGARESDDTALSVARDWLTELPNDVSSESLPEHTLDGAVFADTEYSDTRRDYAAHRFDTNDPFQGTDSYNLRPRQNPRITSDWTVNRWTNPYHTRKIEVQ